MKLILIAVLCLLCAGHVEAQTSPSINKEIQALKRQVIALNRDLFILEEDLLFPTNTQIAVYVSMDIGHFFELDSIELLVDGVNVTHYLYTQKQISSLKKGGIQRLHMGNVSQGKHEVTAILRGVGPNKRDYKIGTTGNFNKDKKALSIELKISDSINKEQPTFELVKR